MYNNAWSKRENNSNVQAHIIQFHIKFIYLDIHIGKTRKLNHLKRFGLPLDDEN